MSEYRYQHLVRQDCPLPPGTHVVGYCRDSGGEEQERSVAQQEQVIREYCNRWGLVLDSIYKDEAEKAIAISRRDEFTEMMQELRAKFSPIYDPFRRDHIAQENPYGVICWKSNRLGRDLLHTRHVKSDLRMRGITIISMVSQFETGNSGLDALIESFFEYQDEQLLKEISDNAKRGLAELVTLRDDDSEFLRHNPGWESTGSYLGIMPGKPPRGFTTERIVVGTYKRKNGKRASELRTVQRLIPDPETWQRAQLAWKMRHEGATIREIMEATRLFKTVSNHSNFFQNLIYTGTLKFGGQYLENFVPAMIPLEWWEEEQARRRERSKKLRGAAMDPNFEPRRVGARHLLSGIIYCGAVEGEEHAMLADSISAKEGVRSRWDFYICTKKKNSRDTRCSSKRVSAKRLEGTVLTRLIESVLTRDRFRNIVDHLFTELNQTNAEASIRLAAAENELSQVEKQLENITSAIENVGLSGSLKEKLTRREADKERLLREVSGLRDALNRAPSVEDISDDVLDAWLSHLHNSLRSENPNIVRRVLHQLIDRVVIRGNKIDIYYRMPLPETPDSKYLGKEMMPHRGYLSFPSQRITFDLSSTKRARSSTGKSSSMKIK